MALRRRIERLTRELRVLIAIILGCFVFIISYRGALITKADALFAEMFHALADNLAYVALFISFFVNAKSLSWLRILSGLTLCGAGIASFIKTYLTFVYIALGNAHTLQSSLVLLLVSVSAVLLIYLQMIFVGKEHDLLHGHPGANSDMRSIHKAATAELLADLIQACAGIVLYVAILVVPINPEAPLIIRFVDLVLTILIGGWMLYRGIVILLGKEDSHNHHSHH